MLNTGTNGIVKSRFIRGANLVAQQISGTSYYYIFNAHGDVLQRVDNTGNRTKRYEYDAFGNQRDFIETDPNPFRYCGEYYDTETNEIYLRARYYNSTNGRFTTEDPAKDGNNWYGYCGGNPVKNIDPSGLGFFDWAKKTVNNAYNSVKNTVNNVVNTVKNTVSNLVENVKNNAKNIANGVKNIVNTGVNLVQTGFNYLIGSYTSPQTQAKNALHNAPLTSWTNSDGTSFIYGQGSNQNFANMQLGELGNGADNGCGIAAAYNAMQLLGKQVNIANMISDFEKNGGIRGNGKGGVWGGSIEKYINNSGHSAKYSIIYDGNLDTTIKNADSVILEYIWIDAPNKDIGMHYVTIEYDAASGNYLIYNEYGNDTSCSPYPSIDTWIQSNGYIPVSNITINQ